VATDLGGGDVEVSWVAAANDNATRYVVRRSKDGGPFSWAGSVNAPGSTFTNTGVTAPGTYEYTVEAKDAAGATAVTACDAPVVIV
jgi:hypothetical protein